LQKEKEGLLEEEVDQHHHQQELLLQVEVEVEVVDQVDLVQAEYKIDLHQVIHLQVIVEEDINYGTKKKKRKR
jgi:hypothetical protein